METEASVQPEQVKSVTPSSDTVLRKVMASLPGRAVTSLPIVLGLILICAIFYTLEPAFLSPRNLSNLMVQMTVTGTLSIGIVLVLLLGDIDLSVGSVMGVCAAALAVLMVYNGWPWMLAGVVALAIGASAGAMQGAWCAYARVPSFVVTLAGFLAFFGVQQHILGREGTINVFDPFIATLTGSYLPQSWGWGAALVAVGAYTLLSFRTSRSKPGGNALLVWLMKVCGVAFIAFGAVSILNKFQGVPTSALIFLTLVVLFDALTQRTKFGRHIYAIGGSVEAARRAGIKINRVRIGVFALTGTLAAIAGILAVSRNQAAGTLTGGGTQMLEAIAAAVIGGTSLFGGRGTVWAALLGVLVIASVSNGIELIGQPPDVKFITQGSILLVAVTLDALGRRRGFGS